MWGLAWLTVGWILCWATGYGLAALANWIDGR